MSSAVAVSKPLFLDAVKNMTIKDAVNILVTDNSHAATDYLKQEMTPVLMTAFLPIVDSTATTEGAATDMMKKVFSYAEQELKRRTQQRN